jgi:hypothetical protein
MPSTHTATVFIERGSSEGSEAATPDRAAKQVYRGVVPMLQVGSFAHVCVYICSQLHLQHTCTEALCPCFNLVVVLVCVCVCVCTHVRACMTFCAYA